MTGIFYTLQKSLKTRYRELLRQIEGRHKSLWTCTGSSNVGRVDGYEQPTEPIWVVISSNDLSGGTRHRVRRDDELRGTEQNGCTVIACICDEARDDLAQDAALSKIKKGGNLLGHALRINRTDSSLRLG